MYREHRFVGRLHIHNVIMMDCINLLPCGQNSVKFSQRKIYFNCLQTTSDIAYCHGSGEESQSNNSFFVMLLSCVISTD